MSRYSLISRGRGRSSAPSRGQDVETESHEVEHEADRFAQELEQPKQTLKKIAHNYFKNQRCRRSVLISVNDTVTGKR